MPDKSAQAKDEPDRAKAPIDELSDTNARDIRAVQERDQQEAEREGASARENAQQTRQAQAAAEPDTSEQRDRRLERLRKAQAPAEAAQPRVGDLEIEQDLAFQVREWRVQRIAWGVMAALIGLAVLGLFGGGILNGVSAGDPNRLAVDYSRFPHVQDATSIRVTVPGPTGEDGRAGVTVSNSLFGDYQINSIVPEPESVTGREDENVYTFQVDGPAEITFNVTPDEAGPHSGQIGLDGGSVLDVFQLVYP